MQAASLTRARVVAVVLLGALVLCAATETEAWPLSGWQLFSRVRTGEQRGWLATVTRPGGGERAIPFGSLPRGFHNSGHTLERWPRMSAAERSAVCAAWRSALDVPAGAIRVYRTVSHLPLNGDPPMVSRTLYDSC